MDFTRLLSIAHKNRDVSKERSYPRSEFSAPKKEKRDKPKSEDVQKITDEKQRAREQEQERRRRMKEKLEAEDDTPQVKFVEEKFTIPKKSDGKPAKINMEDLIRDLDSSDDEDINNVSLLSDSHKKESSRSSSDKHKNHKSSSSHSSSINSHSHHKSSSSSSSKHKSDNDHAKHHQNHESSHRSHSREKEKEKSSSKEQSSSDKHKHVSSNSNKSSSSDSNNRDRPSSSSSKSHSSSSKPHSSTSGTSKSSSSSLSSKSHSSSSTSKSHSSSSTSKSLSSSSNSKSSSSTSSSSHKSSRDHKKDSSSSNSDKKASSSSSSSVAKNSSKKSAKDLSLDELRAEVRKMKEMEAGIEGDDKKKDGLPNAVPFEQAKVRQGIELDDAEAKKAKILARTQAILARTKAMLAKEKDSEKPKRHRGKTGSSGDKHKEGSDKQIKSKSIIKDDDDSDEEEAHELDMTFNSSLQMPGSGDILKDIKRKIDDKLGNYNFPDRPLKEKKIRAKSSSSSSVRVKKISHSSSDIRKDRHDKKHLFSKQQKMKALMRRDYQTSFGEDKPKVKKPVIIRRQQQQPPPMNFEDLLKLAEKKSQEKVPEEPIIPKPKKKVEERPLTKEELDRRQREKESRMRKKREEELARMGKLPDNKYNESKKAQDDPRTQKSKSESSLLKGALTKPQDRSMGKSQFSKGSRYDEENDNDLACGPSSSKPSKPAAPVESTNPWDRIYGQIQKNNPKSEKRKRQILESSEEEESDYDMDDDFIDDGDCVEDVSAHIRNIFGYDKRKYRHIDEDDDDMEANFATIMKEEARSARLGKMEDLEDIRREEEELKMKKLAKMKKMKHR